jgi:hypothetical protein
MMFRNSLQKLFFSICTSVVVFTCLVGSSFAAPKPDMEGKVVLANLDRYDAVVRFGSTRRTIKPKKATVLTPKKFPVTLEYWSGNTRSGWQKKTFTKPGIFGFNFKRGNWSVSELKRGKTAARPRPSAQVLRQRVVQRPVRRAPINADRVRWSPLARVAWAAASVYQFVRDEQDRDLLREMIIRGRLEDLDDLNRWVDESDKIAIPHKAELKDALRELSELSDEDWQTIETADEGEWELAKTDLGDLVSEEQWDKFSTDFDDVSTNDFWEEDVQDVDLNEVDFADNLDVDGDIDVGDDIDLSENVDLGDVGIDTDSYDLGDFDDYGGYDGAMDVDAGDFGGDSFGDDDFGDFGGGDDFDFGGGDDFDF